MMKGADKEVWFKADCPAGTYYAYVSISIALRGLT
jgi:hypothetical protein